MPLQQQHQHYSWDHFVPKKSEQENVDGKIFGFFVVLSFRVLAWSLIFSFCWVSYCFKKNLRIKQILNIQTSQNVLSLKRIYNNFSRQKLHLKIGITYPERVNIFWHVQRGISIKVLNSKPAPKIGVKCNKGYLNRDLYFVCIPFVKKTVLLLHLTHTLTHTHSLFLSCYGIYSTLPREAFIQAK